MTPTLDAWSEQIWAILDPNPELTIALREAINKAQLQDGWCSHCGCGNDQQGFAHLSSCIAAVEEPTPKPRSVVEDFDFIRARIQEIKEKKQTWWCSQCHAQRTQGCDNSACPDKVTMHEDYCYD